MKKIIILWLLMGVYNISHAQIITITDKESGEPVEMATLISENPQAKTITNAKGQADITPFKGSEDIKIFMLGYESIATTYNALEQGGLNISLIPSEISLDQVVISATRWEQPSSGIPSKVSTISRRQIALQNPQTAADLLNISGEVFIQKSQQGGGSPMIRGFSTNRLLYTIDGVRMNTAIFRGGNLQNVISLDPFATEKTEVFFGPGSVIYGSDAIGGVMSFQTLIPELSIKDEPLIIGKAVARYSSANNEKTGHFDVNVGWRKWAMVSSFTTNDYGDLRMGSRGPEEYLRPFYVQQQYGAQDIVVINEDPRVQRPSGYSQMNLMQKVRFKPSEKWDLQYAFHYSETSPYARYDRHIRYRNGLPRYGEWSYGPQKWMMNYFSVTNSSRNVLYDEVSLRLAWQFFEESRISRDILKPNRETRIEKVDALSANLDFIKSVSKKSRVYYGFEGIQNDVNSIGIDENVVTGVKAPGPARYPQATWASYAAYLTGQHEFSEKFLVQAGVRYNQFLLDAVFDTTFYPFPFTTANINNGAITGSVGIVYRPSDKWVISANAATAFRSPNVDDIGKVFDSEPGSVTVPNPGLEAEYAYNADLGIAKVFGNSIKVDLTGYYTILENAIVRRDYTLNGQDSIVYDGELSRVQALQNAAVANVYGIQAGLEWKLPRGFSFSTDFNYQHGEEELEDGTTSPSRHAPPWFGVSRLSYVHNKLNLQFYSMYSGERRFGDMPEEEKGKPEIYAIDAKGNPYAPGWYTLNFKAMYLLTDHFSVSAGLENITDLRYRPYSSGIVAPGRNFILSVKAGF